MKVRFWFKDLEVMNLYRNKLAKRATKEQKDKFELFDLLWAVAGSDDFDFTYIDISFPDELWKTNEHYYISTYNFFYMIDNKAGEDEDGHFAVYMEFHKEGEEKVLELYFKSIDNLIKFRNEVRSNYQTRAYLSIEDIENIVAAAELPFDSYSFQLYNNIISFLSDEVKKEFWVNRQQLIVNTDQYETLDVPINRMKYHVEVLATYFPEMEKSEEKEEKKEKSARADILDKAKQTVCHDRQDQYGEPESSFHTIQLFWSDYILEKYKTMIPLTEEDVAQMMVLQKMARQITGKGKMDNYVDQTGYSAIAGELWDKEMEKKDASSS